MRVLLIRLNIYGFPVPPPYSPIGILYIASYLEHKGFDVKVIDLCKQSENDLWNEITDSDIIGISMLSYVRQQGYDIIKKVKEQYPDKKIVLGGAFPASVANELFEKYLIDAIVGGEGEQSMYYLCNEWKNGNKVERKVYYSPLLDIDSIPFPAWKHTNFDWWDMQIAKSHPDLTINGVRIGSAKWSSIIGSRGCVGKCIFCNAFKHWGYKVRFRSGKNIVDEIEELVTKHNVTLFSFDDDAFPYYKKQVIEFCDEIKKRGLKIAWKGDTRIDGLDKEMLIRLKESGCFMLAVGIESGSQKIIDSLKKNINLQKAKQTIQLIKEAGIIAYELLMVGNVGETEETIKETVQFLKETKPDLYSYVTGVMIVAGTEMQQIAGIPNDFYTSGNGLPIYTKENSMEQLTHYSNLIRQDYGK